MVKYETHLSSIAGKIIYFSTGLTALQYYKIVLSSFKCRTSKDTTSTYHSSLTDLT